MYWLKVCNVEIFDDEILLLFNFVVFDWVFLLLVFLVLIFFCFINSIRIFNRSGRKKIVWISLKLIIRSMIFLKDWNI